MNLRASARAFNEDELRGDARVCLGIVQAHSAGAQADGSPRLFDIPYRPAIIAALRAGFTGSIPMNINMNHSPSGAVSLTVLT